MLTSCLNKAIVWAVLSVLITLAASQNYTACEAEVTLNSTEPSLAFYIYHSIVVENVGLCDITNVEVEILVPPGDSIFAYYNVSNSTGELLGLNTPMPQGSVQVGGMIVLNSARTPIVSLKFINCSTNCSVAPANSSESSTDAPLTGSANSTASPDVDPVSSSPPADNSSTLQLKLHRGSNAHWFALNILYNGEPISMEKVMLKDAANYSTTWEQMSEANWGGAPTYSFSPMNGPLSLPISLKLVTTTEPREVIVLRHILPSFSSVLVDSGVEYDQN